MNSNEKNVLGGALATCSDAPRTGFYRDGCCNTGPEDHGLHVVCVQVTAEFLEFARSQGNDLITPVPEYDFPGLEPGDRWCVCAATWRRAYEAGVASPVVLAATQEETLAVIPLAALVSWGIALAEYLLQVPANRIGYTALSLGELKIMQEVITLAVFVPFAVTYMGQPLKLDYLWAGLCLLGAVYFMFRA